MPERQGLTAACVARQRLECASLLALLLAARSNPRRLGLRSRTKAATSRRSPNAVAPAKPPAAPRVRYAPNAYHSGGYGRVPFNVHGFDRDFVFSLIGRW